MASHKKVVAFGLHSIAFAEQPLQGAATPIAVSPPKNDGSKSPFNWLSRFAREKDKNKDKDKDKDKDKKDKGPCPLPKTPPSSQSRSPFSTTPEGITTTFTRLTVSASTPPVRGTHVKSASGASSDSNPSIEEAPEDESFEFHPSASSPPVDIVPPLASHAGFSFSSFSAPAQRDKSPIRPINICTFPESLLVLKLLQKMGMEMAVITSSSPHAAEEMISRVGLAKYFAHTVILPGSKECHLRELCKRAHVELSDIVYFDVSTESIRQAEKIGVYAVCVSRKTGATQAVVNRALKAANRHRGPSGRKRDLGIESVWCSVKTCYIGSSGSSGGSLTGRLLLGRNRPPFLLPEVGHHETSDSPVPLGCPREALLCMCIVESTLMRARFLEHTRAWPRPSIDSPAHRHPMVIADEVMPGRRISSRMGGQRMGCQC
eukprot:jgi/Mesvir1/21077/Mv17230-RA.1